MDLSPRQGFPDQSAALLPFYNEIRPTFPSCDESKSGKLLDGRVLPGHLGVSPWCISKLFTNVVAIKATSGTSSKPSTASAQEGDFEASGNEPDAIADKRMADERRIVMVGGTVFLVVMTAQYLYRVFDKPDPLPWKRGDAFQAFQVDINSASWIEWAQLPGIGPSLSHRIVAHRTVHGPFQSINELTNVDGIGPETLKRIRPWLKLHAEQPSSQR